MSSPCNFYYSMGLKHLSTNGEETKNGQRTFKMTSRQTRAVLMGPQYNSNSYMLVRDNPPGILYNRLYRLYISVLWPCPCPVDLDSYIPVRNNPSGVITESTDCTVHYTVFYISSCDLVLVKLTLGQCYDMCLSLNKALSYR